MQLKKKCNSFRTGAVDIQI